MCMDSSGPFGRFCGLELVAARRDILGLDMEVTSEDGKATLCPGLPTAAVFYGRETSTYLI